MNMIAGNFVSLASRESGECSLVGQDYLKIPDGEYEAILSHYETNPRFSKRTDKPAIHTGGKVYLWFQIDPYGSSELPPDPDRKVFLPYNAKSITKPFGKNGKFVMGKRSKCYKEYKRIFDNSPKNRLSLNDYKGKLLKVKVRTVVRNEKQKKHSKDEQYSEIEEICELC